MIIRITNVAVDPSTARIAFDSVRLTRINDIEVDAGPAVSSPDAGTEGEKKPDGGCSSSNGSSSTGLVFFLLGLGMTFRRRKEC